jgi:hypothetical protein
MKKVFKEIYNDFNVPIGKKSYIEMGGFVIVLLLFLGSLFLLQWFGVINIEGFKY